MIVAYGKMTVDAVRLSLHIKGQIFKEVGTHAGFNSARGVDM